MAKHFIIYVLLVFVVCSRAVCATETISPDLQEVAKTEEGAEGDDKWTGVDVSIVGKYAEKYGRPPRKPYINTDQGDLLLFVFTTAGVIGGFIIGYNFRKLFHDKDKNHIHNIKEVK